MLVALLLGVIGSSALVIGGALGAVWDAPRRLTGVFLAFASGTLISALAFELFPEAVELGGTLLAAIGLVAGALVFVVVNTWLDARTLQGAGDAEEVPGVEAMDDSTAQSLAPATADEREKVTELAARAGPESDPGQDADGPGPTAGQQTGTSAGAGAGGAGAGGAGVGAAVGLALLAAVTLDGVPENLALGVSLAGGDGAAGGVALLVAIVASNLPESLVGGIAMRRGGRSARFVVLIWSAAAVALTLAVVLGYGLVAGLDPRALSFALSFAGGAVLASLADTLMPEAFEHGRPFNAFATAAGFLLSFVLATG